MPTLQTQSLVRHYTQYTVHSNRCWIIDLESIRQYYTNQPTQAIVVSSEDQCPSNSGIDSRTSYSGQNCQQSNQNLVNMHTFCYDYDKLEHPELVPGKPGHHSQYS